ncbi:DUF305 domain-containing protein [Bradyrhizobium sp. 159]|uniref:DUF305 domain-containing protein n=1 Tax=Bradyrhizobium sp. 159 TaxID=2782632 RepID=UPI001FF7EA45|nr:DUF305 domain-containing protein [Bradyrhizobium sp. 159]MCK1616489.1 DUF305 domain-containing protein [Bradyrhizobium sp. 159]
MEFDVPLFSRGFVRRRAISLATSLSVMATSFALAQDPKHGSEARRTTGADEQQFLFEIDLAMSNMNRSMLTTPTDDIDRDFVNVMVPHHQGAIDLARAEIKYGRNDALRQLAKRMVSEQEEEISSLSHALPAVVSLAPSTGAEIASHAPK